MEAAMSEHECGCAYTAEGESPSVYRESKQLARKCYVCGECEQPIEVGQFYHRVFGVWEGKASTYFTCATCQSIRDHIFCNGYTHGRLFDELYEYLYDCYPEAPWSRIREMSPEAQDVVIKLVIEIHDERAEQAE